MESLILKLASIKDIQFGVVTIVLLAIFAWIIKWIMERNKELVNQNQQNIISFVNQINHQQTKNREALAANTAIIAKVSENVDKNNEINEKLIEFLKQK